MKLKRWLYLIHRWLGIGMCLLIAMWFFSGIVMMYVGFPQLTFEERLSALPVLQPESVQVPPARLLEGLPDEARIRSLKLTTLHNRPVYQLRTASGAYYTGFADTGESLGEVTAEKARASASAFYRGSATIRAREVVDMDQWTVSGSLHPHRPLHKISFDDAAATQLYVSSLTGEVVRDTTRNERVWNWLGANLHWIYPRVLRQHATLWHWVIVVLSLIGLVSIVTGGIIGYMRLRIRKKYRGRDVTPYRGWMKWHHLLGLATFVFLTTFMFSGLMSMNPWDVFTPSQSYADLREHYRGDTRNVGDATDFERLREALRNASDIKQVEWHWLAGQAIPVAIAAPYDYRAILSAKTDSRALLALGKQRLQTQMQQYAPEAKLLDEQWIGNYDLYYYSHHQRWRPLPVLRLRFDNPDRSWVYLDGATGELLSHQTRHSRVQRWLYHGLHSLDFNFLIQHRPAWDIVVIVLSALGFFLAATSVVIGWRRLNS